MKAFQSIPLLICTHTVITALTQICVKLLLLKPHYVYFEANNLNILPDILSQEQHYLSHCQAPLVISSSSQHNSSSTLGYQFINNNKPQPAPRSRTRRHSAVNDSLSLPKPVPERRSRSITNPVVRGDTLESLQTDYQQYIRADSPLLSATIGSRSVSRSRSVKSSKSTSVSSTGAVGSPRRGRRATVARIDLPGSPHYPHDNRHPRVWSVAGSPSTVRDLCERKGNYGKDQLSKYA